jgi:hypothetical protein
VEIGTTAAGQTRRVLFQFRCDLAPGDYTISVTSQDENGAVCDWMEEALSFTVVDERRTLGVANLRARVAVD